MLLRALAALLAMASAAFTAHATSPRAAVSAALADAGVQVAQIRAQGGDTRDLESYRYFWVATPPGKAREEFRAAFKLHVNFLSRYSEIVDVVEVRPWLWRLDIDEPQWDRATLEAAQHVDPYFHKRVLLKEDATFQTLWPGGVDTSGATGTRGQKFPRGESTLTAKAGQTVSLAAPWLDPKEILELRKLLYTEVPVLNAEWFLAQSCRQLSLNNKQTGLGYYDFLRLKDRADWFKLVGYDEAAAKRLKKDIRSAQEVSGVSPAARQMVRDVAAAGPVWVALDTDDPTGRGVAIRNLKAGQYVHKIEEWYGFLANELPTTFLSNDQGVRQNNAPADLAGFRDDSPLNEGRDGRIHVHIACLRCHAGQVLRPIDDWVRKTFQAPAALGDPNKHDAIQLRRQYFSDLDRSLRRDQVVYREALTRATVTPAFPRGLSAQKACEVYARAFHAYADDAVGLAIAAQWVGVTEASLRERLEWQFREVKLLDIRLMPLIAKRPLTISRLTLEDSFELLAELAAGHIPDLRKP